MRPDHLVGASSHEQKNRLRTGGFFVHGGLVAHREWPGGCSPKKLF